MEAPPSSWAILNQDRQTRALVAKDAELFLLDHGGQYQEQVRHFVLQLSNKGERLAFL